MYFYSMTYKYMTIFNRFPRVHIRTFDAQERQWKYKTSCIPFMVSLSNFPFCNSFQNSFYMSGVIELEERELPYLDDHKESCPVSIGNGAATDIQLVRASSYCSRGFWFSYN